MLPPRSRLLFVLVLALVEGACAGGAASPAGDPPKPAGSPATSAAAASSAAAPVERPFAASAQQATDLIGQVLDKRAPALQKCVAEHRTRKNVPHERVEISVGIDQNGILIGATMKKGRPDPAFDTCIQSTLSGALFPKSQAGIITMTKSYEDIVQ